MYVDLERFLRYEVWASVAIGLAMIFVVVGGFWLSGTAGHGIADLQEQLASLQAAIDSKDTQLEDLQVQVENQSTQIDGLGSQIAAKDVKIAVLQNQIDTMTQLTYLQTQLSELESQIEVKDNQISDLEETVDTLESENTALRAELDAVDLRVLGVYFNPADGCEDQILNWVNNANGSIHILAYCFTLDSVGDALIEAYDRGVEVKIVFEQRQLIPISEYERLKATGIPVRTDTNTRFMNNKVMIVDGEIVLTGSYDWTETAETFNDENLIVINSIHLASLYEEEFSRIWAQSQA